MPEGPEILWNAAFYKKYLHNCKININKYNDYDVIDVACKGKQLWIQVSDCNNNEILYIHIHFGLSGKIYIDKNIDKSIIKNIRHRIQVYDKPDLLLVESRMNALMQFDMLSENEHFDKINKLGMSVFDTRFTLNEFKKAIGKRKCMLAAFLMDQHVFSGIGNYIKNEVIYMGKLRPKVKLNELSNNDIKLLHHNILYVSCSNYMKKIMKSGLRRDDVAMWISNEEIVNLDYSFSIYNRKMTDDGKKVHKIKVSGRDSYTTEDLL